MPDPASETSFHTRTFDVNATEHGECMRCFSIPSEMAEHIFNASGDETTYLFFYLSIQFIPCLSNAKKWQAEGGLHHKTLGKITLKTAINSNNVKPH